MISRVYNIKRLEWLDKMFKISKKNKPSISKQTVQDKI